MDLFMPLNYRYPGTSVAARPRVSQQSQEVTHHVVQNIQSMQDHFHPGDGCSDSSRIAYKGTLTGLRDAVHSDSAGPMKIYHADDSENLSDQYIPSSSDKITCTDHRPLDEIFGSIRPPRAQVKSGSIYPLHTGTPRGHPRNVLTYPLPLKPQLDGVVHTPLLAVDNQMSGTSLIVDFQCSDWGIGVQVEGIPMPDLLHGNVSDLKNPYQRVLDGLSLINLRLNILWPYYPPFVKVISAFGRDGKSITRAELGYEVSLAFAEFFYQITSQSILPAHPGPYTISVSSSTGSSSSGIKFDQLHLLRVRDTSHGEWVAEIRTVSMS